MKRYLLGLLFLFNNELQAEMVTDDMGRKIQIKNTPKRIISMAPNITEIIYKLNMEKHLVGISTFSNYPIKAKSLPRVGSYIQPNYEKIIKLNPDIVIGTAAGLSKEHAARFDTLKIPLYVTFPKTIHDIPLLFYKLGVLLGVPTKGRMESSALSKEIIKFQGAFKVFPQAKVFYIVEHEPLIGAGNGTFIDDLLHLANFVNILKGDFQRFPKISPEYLIKMDPDYIISGAISDASLFSIKKYRVLKAVQTRRIFRVNPDIFNRPGPRIVEALNSLLSIRKEKTP